MKKENIGSKNLNRIFWSVLQKIKNKINHSYLTFQCFSFDCQTTIYLQMIDDGREKKCTVNLWNMFNKSHLQNKYIYKCEHYIYFINRLHTKKSTYAFTLIYIIILYFNWSIWKRVCELSTGILVLFNAAYLMELEIYRFEWCEVRTKNNHNHNHNSGNKH